MTDALETARWVAEGRLRPWEVANESVVEMARKLVESLAALEASQQALNDTVARSTAELLDAKKVLEESRRVWFIEQQQTTAGVLLPSFNVVRRDAEDNGWEHHGRGGYGFGEAMRICNGLNGVRR